MTRIERPDRRLQDIAADRRPELLRPFAESRIEAGKIDFNRYFYKYTLARPPKEIDAEPKQAEEEILWLLREVTE